MPNEKSKSRAIDIAVAAELFYLAGDLTPFDPRIASAIRWHAVKIAEGDNDDEVSDGGSTDPFID